MKFSISNAAVTAFLLAAPMASAQPQRGWWNDAADRAANDGPAPFQVCDFYAGTVPHSVQNYYGFTVSQGDRVSNCTANLHSYQRMADVAVTVCDEPMWSFNFSRATDGAGALLKVWLTLDKEAKFEGRHHVPADQLVVSGVGTSIKEEYTGPHEFTIDDVEAIAVA